MWKPVAVGIMVFMSAFLVVLTQLIRVMEYDLLPPEERRVRNPPFFASLMRRLLPHDYDRDE
jgi:hypothetical protein